MRAFLSCALRQKLLQQSVLPLLATPTVSPIQLRYKNKKARVREEKVQVDKNQKYISKKQRKSTVTVTSKVDEEKTILAEAPVDNVWVRRFYPPPQYSIEETIDRHKDFAQPAMLNNMKGLIFADMKLDYTTKKKGKFMNNIRFTLRLPHEFPFGSPPNILVFCKNEELVNLATSLGAKNAGPPEEIIKMITSGVINPKDFEHVLCTSDCANEILPARSHFRDKFPQRAKGSVGPDLQIMWDLFYYGYTFESQKVTDAVGRVQVPLGLLEQPTADLSENFMAYIDCVCQQRSVALGPFIQSIKVVAPPSPEEFLVKVQDYVPGYKNEEVDSDEDEEEGAVAK